MGKMGKISKKRIPEFTSEEEEAEFWSTHDTTEYWEDTEEVSEDEVKIDPKLRKQILERGSKARVISLRLNQKQLDFIKETAKRENIGYQILIRNWIEERIQSEYKSERFSRKG